LAYIQSISEEKIILIIEYFSESLLSVLEAFKQVEAVILYTFLPSDKLPSRIIAHCTNEEQLVDELNSIRQELNKQMIVFSIYNQQNKEKHDLTHEAGSFLFFQLFKAAFKALPKNPESKKLMISKYRNYYAGDTKILKEIHDFELYYKSNGALQWYINDSFITRLINKALRTENINALCYFHFFIGDLSKQLEKEFIKYKKHNSKSVLRVYRGFKITKEEIKTFERNIGNLILTNGYLSTTRQRQVAHHFATQQKTRTNEDKVLFEYTVDLALVKSIVFADISQYHQFSEKDEILFDLGTAFKINSCTYNEKEQLWLVNVSATDDGVDIASEYIEYQKAKMTESNLLLMLGHLIIETGDYDKAEKYFNGLLHSSIPNDEEIACIYYNMGRVYRLKGDYDHAVDYLNQAYITHSEARPARLASAAKTMNAMGILCMELNNVEQAIDSFECALKLYTKTIQEYHPDIGGTLINLGNIYSEQGEFEGALSCFKRAEKIYEYNLPPNHPNIAILLNNIGNLYYQQANFDLALDVYKRALEINEKILSPNHPVIARNRHNLSRVYASLGDQTKAQFQLEQASHCDEFDIKSLTESMKINPDSWKAVGIHNVLNTESIEMNNR
jgi:tetratricopeptide (TPR) repeat protein